MDVDDFDAATTDGDLAASLRVQSIEGPADRHCTGHTRDRCQEVSSIGCLHLQPPLYRGTLLQRNGGVKHNVLVLDIRALGL